MLGAIKMECGCYQSFISYYTFCEVNNTAICGNRVQSSICASFCDLVSATEPSVIFSSNPIKEFPYKKLYSKHEFHEICSMTAIFEGVYEFVHVCSIFLRRFG